LGHIRQLNGQLLWKTRNWKSSTVLNLPETWVATDRPLQEEKMSLKHLTVGALMAVCTFAVQASAQNNELSGLLGRTLISHQRIPGAPSFDPNLRFGKGWSFEVNYARRVVGAGPLSLYLEVPFVGNPDEDLHAQQNLIPEHFSSYFVTPAARLQIFSDQAVSPWVSFGGGVAHFGEGSTLRFGGPNPGKTGTTTGVVQAGLGFDVKAFHRFSIRGEVRDFWSGVPQLNVTTVKSRQRNLFVGVGVVWHF
jgi:hypothetical protein